MMDTRLLRYYEKELQHLRDMGGEFAQQYPKIAGRLGLESNACADPYVERLLEGFSFLAARIQLKMDAEFPRFINHLLEIIYPQYLAPTPSMAIVQCQSDLNEGSLAAGFTLARGTALRSLLGKGDQTSCEFRTAHEVCLWPLEITEAHYFTVSGSMAGMDISRWGPVKAGLRLRLKVGAGLCFKDLALERLPLYLRGSDALPNKLLEQLLAHAVGMIITPGQASPAWHKLIDKKAISALGFTDDEALIPCGARGFHAYRLLHEYFALPERFMFVELGGLAEGVQACDGAELDILILFDQLDASLEQVVSANNFALFCTPAINLFPKRCDRIHLSDKHTEFHIVPDRTRPLDYEVWQVLGVQAYGTGVEVEKTFTPLYQSNDLHTGQDDQAYFQIRRAKRIHSDQRHKESLSLNYLGSEVFLSLVDASETPLSMTHLQCGVDTLCSNRDRVLGMPIGVGKTDFTVDSSAPVLSVRCLSGPTMPAHSHAEGETAWRLINHLSLNYLSLMDVDGKEGAQSLRELLRLYVNTDNVADVRQVEGVRAISSCAIVRRLPVAGPISYARGLQITLTLDDAAFEGSSAFLLGAVLEQFFAKYVSLNSFTETVVKTTRRGDIMRWPARIGLCEIL